MKKTCFLALLMLHSLLFSAQAQRSNQRQSAQSETYKQPKLIVNIAIDGLRSDFLALFWNDLDPNGFRRLIQNGTYCPNMSFPYLCVGNAADYASAFTGTIPSDHSICGDTYYDPKTRKEMSCLFDPDRKGVDGNQQISPRSLQTSTFVDELRLNTQGKSKIITIGINGEEAALMAGHGDNPTVWIDDLKGTWTSSTYYGKNLPSWAMRMNGDNPAAGYIRQNWSNFYISSQYRAASSQSRSTPLFAYSMYDGTRRKEQPFKEFKESPFANTMVLSLAKQAIYDEYIGLDNIPDVVNLQFTLRGFNQATAGVLTSEIQDMYFRLDKDIAALLELTDKLCGEHNVLYMIFASQKEYTSPDFLKNYSVPTGYFVADRSMALLNSYLIATYGQGDYIQGYSNRQIFLNKGGVESKGLNVEDVETKIAEFMVRFQGVQYAFRSVDMQKIVSAPERIQKARNAFHAKYSGDILLYLQPGWVDVPDESYKIGVSTRVNAYAPFILSGWRIKRQKVSQPFSVIDIAPTMSNLLFTAFPSSSMGNPLLNADE